MINEFSFSQFILQLLFSKVMLEIEPVFKNLRDLPAYREIMGKQF